MWTVSFLSLHYSYSYIYRAFAEGWQSGRMRTIGIRVSCHRDPGFESLTFRFSSLHYYLLLHDHNLGFALTREI